MKRNVLSWAALAVSSAALLSSSGLMRTMPAAPKITAESQKAAQTLSEAFNTVSEFAKPSVVQISVERKAAAPNVGRNGRRMPFPGGQQGETPKEFEDMLRQFLPQGPGQGRPEKEQFGRGVEGVGSGFVYDDRGHILTNNHVVDKAAKIVVTFHDGVEATATVVGTDPQSDVAVIKVDNTNYRPLPKGQSAKLKVGDLVMAVGSPYHLDQSVTTGIVSATERNSVGINDYESFIQTDAAINPGNSGGPLVNMDGQVIGVNSAIVSGGRGNDGVGFAIPIDMAGALADNLIKNGKVLRSRVGIVLDPLSPVIARQLGLSPKTKGVVVGNVVPGSPADKAGLKQGDVITEFNRIPVTSRPNFRLVVASSEAGHEIRLKYWREGKQLETSIVPAPSEEVVFEQEKAKPKVAEEKVKDAPKADFKGFGLEVQPVTPELAQQFGYDMDVKGLLVAEVKEGSPAEAAGLEAGLLITKVVKDQKVQTLNSIKEFEVMVTGASDLAVFVETPKGGGHFITLSKPTKD